MLPCAGSAVKSLVARLISLQESLVFRPDIFGRRCQRAQKALGSPF